MESSATAATSGRARVRARGVVLVVAAALVAGCAGSASTDTSPGPADQPDGSDPAGEPREELAALLPEPIRESGVITVGTPMGIPPGIGLGDDGTPFGIGPDLGAAMGDLLGVEFVWQEVDFADVLPGLQDERFDLSMGLLGDTPERQEVVDFVDLLGNETVLMVRAGDEAEVVDLSDLCGATVGTLDGALQIETVELAGAECVSSGAASIEVAEFPVLAQTYDALDAGAIDAVIAPYLILNLVATEHGGGSTFTITDGRYPDDPWAIGLNKDADELTQAIHAALLQLVEDGTYDDILARWDAEAVALDPDQIVVNGAGTAAFE